MDVITGDEPEITALRIVHFVPRSTLQEPRTPRSPMLRSIVCRSLGHKWGENIHEVTSTGRRIFHVCGRCRVEETIAKIRDAGTAWKPRLETRGDAA
jgi:hypothetical protein